jgi:hypothetical protein
VGIFNAFGLVNVQEDADRFFDRLEKSELQEEVHYLSSRLQDVEEDMLAISDAFDNVGWAPLNDGEASAMKLTTVKKVSKVARGLNALNPFVKRGVEARIAYVWGKGVTFDGVDSIGDKMDENRKKLFTPQAYSELERVLATDGNAFTALPNDNAKPGTTAFRISLDEIEGAVSNPLDAEEIWFYKRSYSVTKTNSQTGAVTTDNIVKYYASLGYYQKLVKQDKALPRRWNKIGVEQEFVVQHTTVNKQVGWRWGVPDIMPVIFWAKAYKEYLEDNAMLVKAYSRLAWQIKAGSAAGAQAAATQVMRAPTRDPYTGEVRDIGGTGISGLGGDIAALPATGSQVDFSKGSAMAAAIAAGLEVSLVVILSDSGNSNRAAESSLDLPTLKAMESRQAIHTDRFLEIFEFWGADITPPRGGTKSIEEAKTPGEPAGYAIITWPQIESDTTKDRIAALGTAVEEGILYKQEARKDALDVFGIAPFKPWDELPTMEDDPAAKEKFDQQQEQFNQQQEANAVIAKQGVSGGVAAKGGAMSTNNQARDSRKANSNKS